VNFKNIFWYFDKALPSKLCDDIIKHGNSKKEELALTGAQGEKKENQLTEKELMDLKKKRDSNIVWLNDHWIYKEIHPYVQQANKSAGWNFEWDWSESCQFTKYKLNQHYGWHQDAGTEPYEEKAGSNFTGKLRKLSVAINLSDETEYEGGDLEFDSSTPEKIKNIITPNNGKSKGTVVVFPSSVWHRVKPVTKGTKYSLVIWCCGKPFK
tara:strand:- start:835 stop:1464 length:630 start_codon:yes stop_codon:yes gene_type:complete